MMYIALFKNNTFCNVFRPFVILLFSTCLPVSYYSIEAHSFGKLNSKKIFSHFAQ